MPNPMRLIFLLDGPAKISRALGIHESAVSRWPERGIPPGHAPKILEMAEGVAAVARRTRTLVETRDGNSYGADAFMKAVRAALDVEICSECGQVVK